MTSQMRNEQSTMHPDPWTEAGYADWRPTASALTVRRRWMEMMGLDEDEIERDCAPGTPADREEELIDYNVMVALGELNRRRRAGA